MLALTGTPVNVIVNDVAADYGVAGVRILRVRPGRHPARRSGPSPSPCSPGERLLPTRTPKGIPSDFSRHARDARRAIPPRRRPGDRSSIAHVRRSPRSSSRRGPASSARSPSRAWSRTAATSSCWRSSAGRGHGPRRDRSWPSATRCCSRGRGPRSTRTSTARTCSSSTRRSSIRRQAVPLGLRAQEAIVVLVGMVVAAGDRDRPVRRRRPARGRGDGPAPGRHAGGRLPVDLVDDGRPRRRDDPAVDGDDRDRRRGPRRRHPRRRSSGRPGRRRCWPACSSSRRCSASSSATWRRR